MSLSHCEKEQAVLEAARAGRWEEDLRAHAAECAVCAEIVLVARFLQQEAEEARWEAALPEPGELWWKAQLLAKRTTAERAIRPIALFEKLAYGCGALALAAVSIWLWPQVKVWLNLLKFLWVQTPSPGSPSQASYFLLVSAGLFLFLVLFAFYAAWAEE